MLFSKPSRAVGVDIGTYSVKTVQMSKAGGKLRIDSAGYALIDSNRLNTDPIEAQSSAVREALRRTALGGSIFVGALPGQAVVIRYPRLPDATDTELQRAIEREASQNLPYELSEVFLDWTVLDRGIEGTEAVAKVLLVAAKHELIDSRLQIGEAADIHFNILGVDSLALADAAESCDFLRIGETVALIDIGASSTIVHFVKDGLSNFYRDVNWGAREMTQAIGKARRCDTAVAEQLLRDMGHSTPPAMPEAQHPIEEPHSLRSGGLMEGFGKTASSPKSELEDLGGSPLDPLDEELSVSPATPAPLAPQIGGAGAGVEQSLDSILHAPLARLVGEIRRSFDYYEQQLYERPVDRILLSGGAAHLTVLRNTLREELALEHVEVADPADSALFLGREDAIEPMSKMPAQFMVAVGLAARGMAEL